MSRRTSPDQLVLALDPPVGQVAPAAAGRPGIDPATLAAQRTASDPLRSAWVSANAGSGKTFVLARRVIRLLLAGTDPARILCLTFTKAAAAEMAQRVFDELAGWIRLGDDDLALRLAAIEDRRPDARRLAEARRLFARALETPGGLKIQTIHAFCERLLHQFPLEANVAGHFEVLDDRLADALLAGSRRAVLAEAGAGHGPLGNALRTVIGVVSDVDYERAVAECVGRRADIAAWVEAAGDLKCALVGLRAELGLGPDDGTAAIDRDILAEAALGPDDIAALVPLLAGGGKSDSDAGLRLAPYLTASGEAERLDAYLAFFLTGEGGVRAPGRLVSKAVKAGWPGLDALLEAECRRIEDLLERRLAASCFEASEALLILADAVIGDYERAKARRGLLDFGDLVERTVALLSRSDARRWVHYKLDQGLDHILVDEAQDTSPAQWRIVTTLAEEFFAGAGAADRLRTLFAVGDEKQSIYSFQGAVPAWFARIRRMMRGRAQAAGLAWSDVPLRLSFRSTPDVLAAVDLVFAAATAHDGLSSEEERGPQHDAVRRGEPGRVVVWPMVEAPPLAEPEGWLPPVDRLPGGAPELVLAERIATTIRGWLDRGERLEGTGAAIRPGGILILTRRRGPLSDAINRALKEHRIPIAGADRLALAGHIAVQDLLVAGDVMLLPEDDLALAALLKSPLFGLDEDGLFALAHKRHSTVWQALERADAPDLAAMAARLRTWRSRADFVSPHAFYAHLLGADGGRRRFAARLGAEAEDVLDEFLAQALAYERVETPSLQGFLAWMRATATEIKRDAELIRDEVRVMTVHGAKGLEADIVFLADDGAAPGHSSHDPRLVALADDPDAAEPAPLVWARSKSAVPATVAGRIDALRRRADQEYRRLLYVALTRARDRLYVCGTRKKRTDEVRGWHGMVQRALEPGSVRVEGADGTLEALEWPANRTATSAAARKPSPLAPPPVAALPEWIGRPVPPPRAERRLAPSAASAEAEDERPRFPAVHALDARLDPSARSALERGRVVHLLLEALPEHEPAVRPAAAARYLDGACADWPEAERRALAEEVLAVMQDPAFAPVFAPGSRAELALAGRIDTPSGAAVVTGRIDRIAVTPDRVLIVDYKTNRPAPAGVDAVPAAYLAQLALYRLLVGRLYPGRRVDAAIVWTDGPRLMELPGAALDRAAPVPAP